jgi:FtsH-binding integral membrane protein
MSLSNTTTYTDTRGKAKFAAVVYGFLFLGLAVTAIVAFAFAYFFTKYNFDASLPNGYSDQAITTLIVICVVSFVISIVDSFVTSHFLSRDKKGAWIPYLIYCVCMGVWPAFLLIFGVSFELMGEAFGLTSLCFLVMFCIGYFSKSNLSSLGVVALGLLVGYILVALVFGIWYWLSPSTWYIWDLVGSLVLITVSMLLIGYESWQMNRTADYGSVTTNTALYYAFTFYCDFITIFMRVLYILIAAKNNN